MPRSVTHFRALAFSHLQFLARLQSQMGHLDSAMRNLLAPAEGDEADPGVSEMKEELRKLVDTVDSNDPNSADGAQNISQTMKVKMNSLISF